MAKRIPTQFIVAAFTTEDAVDKVEKEIMDAEFESKQVLCTNMAVAKKDIAGKLAIKEMGNPAALHGKPVGGQKLLGGFSLLLLGNGTTKAANLGGSISKYGATNVIGMDKDHLGKIGAALKPGTSAIILVFDEVFVDVTQDSDFLKNYQAKSDTVTVEMAAKIEESLKAGKDITYHFAIDENGVAMTREIQGADASNISDILITPLGVVTKDVDVRASGTMKARTRIITPDLYASMREAMTKSTVAYTARAITEDTIEVEGGMIHVEKM
jgi:uncharacterized membrane protein